MGDEVSRVIRYLTHPQVNQDPATPVPQWGLSPLGRERLLAVARRGVLSDTGWVVSSAETKALETAAVFAHALGLETVVRERMHENDRSATGYLAPAEFEATADQFFAQPDASVRGWERACDAQRRVVMEFEAILSSPSSGDLLVVGHGAVGTLLYCHLAGLPISRSQDQPAGGGNFFSVSMRTLEPLHGWQPIEDMTALSPG